MRKILWRTNWIYIAVRSFQLCRCRCDCRWYIYIFFYMMMVTSNLQCSIMDQRSHGNKQLFDETYFHLWIGHLFCFPLYMYIMCTVRLNKTVQARFMNKCWRHDFSLHLINLYMGNFFLKKKILHQIIIMIINLHYICINLSNWPYALFACWHVRLHTWITTYQCLLYLLYNIMTCMRMPL